MPDYGVVIGWVPGNYSQRVQVARSADDGSGNPDTTTTTLLATALPDQTYYYDALPPDNAFRHYQVRHVLTGLIDGAWSSYVRAKPKLVPPSYLDSVGDQTSPASAALPSSYTVGDLLYASAAAALSKRAAVATGNLLISQGASTAPAWGKLASTHLSGDYTFPGSLTITGTLSGVTTLTATTIGGTLSTAAQANVTSLGTLAANLLFVDATYDIGASGATRPRDFFLSRNATIGGTVTSVGLLTVQAGLTVSGGGIAIQVAGGQEVQILDTDGSGEDLRVGANSFDPGQGAIGMLSNHPLAFYTNSTRRGAILSSGRWVVNKDNANITDPSFGALVIKADSALTEQLALVDLNVSPKATWRIGLSAGGDFDGIGFYNATAALLRFRMLATGEFIPAGGLTITGGSISASGIAATVGALTATTVTGTGLFLTPASASGGAGLRLPHGTAPSSPTDGDIWTTTAGLYVRINGGTVGPLT